MHDFHHTSSGRLTHIRARRRWALLKALFLTVAAVGFLLAVGSFVLKDLEKKGVLDRLRKGKPLAREKEMGLGGGFHILDGGYWEVFDNADLLARPVVKAPRPKPEEKKIEAEGLTVHTMKVRGPYTIVNDMGGLVPSAVGIWTSPNRLGQGREAFYGLPGEEVELTHWVRNFGGFKVFRVLNKKKRLGPGNKLHEAGWLLGIYLVDGEGNPIR